MISLKGLQLKLKLIEKVLDEVEGMTYQTRIEEQPLINVSDGAMLETHTINIWTHIGENNHHCEFHNGCTSVFHLSFIGVEDRHVEKIRDITRHNVIDIIDSIVAQDGNNDLLEETTEASKLLLDGGYEGHQEDLDCLEHVKTGFELEQMLSQGEWHFQNNLSNETKFHTQPYCASCGSENVDINSAGGTSCNDCNGWGCVSCPDTLAQGETCDCWICEAVKNHPRNK